MDTANGMNGDSNGDGDSNSLDGGLHHSNGTAILSAPLSATPFSPEHRNVPPEAPPPPPDPELYDLFAVTKHMGSMNGTHTHTHIHTYTHTHTHTHTYTHTHTHTQVATTLPAPSTWIPRNGVCCVRVCACDTVVTPLHRERQRLGFTKMVCVCVCACVRVCVFVCVCACLSM
jgi:hypothetical protein